MLDDDKIGNTWNKAKVHYGSKTGHHGIKQKSSVDKTQGLLWVKENVQCGSKAGGLGVKALYGSKIGGTVDQRQGAL